MALTTHQILPKIMAMMAAICTNCTAVALTELPAEFVSFWRITPLLPPAQNVSSAVSPLLAADNSAGIMQFMQ